jgi:hypothetical protein
MQFTCSIFPKHIIAVFCLCSLPKKHNFVAIYDKKKGPAWPCFLTQKPVTEAFLF